jgi:hypothetical protein
MMHAAIICAIALFSSVPPDAKTQARSHYRAGIALAKSKDWNDALVQFREAERIVARDLDETEAAKLLPAILYEIGLASEQTGDEAGAFDAFDRYLAKPPEKPTAKALEHARAVVEKLKPRFARIELRGPAGAKISIDGVTTGVLPIARSIVVTRGKHSVRAEAEGFSPNPLEIEIEVGANPTELLDLGERMSTAQLALEPAPAIDDRPAAPAVTAAPPPPPLEDSSGPSGLKLGLVGASGAVLVAGAVFTILAITTSSDVDGLVDRNAPVSVVRDREDTGRTQALVADILVPVGIASGLASLFLLE